MSLLSPALQKFYSALKNLKQFSVENGFFDNISCIDNFLSEYRSTTLVIPVSLGDKTNPVYTKNLNEYILKDEKLSKWLNDQRVNVVHKHPFKLKKILRIIIYDSVDSVVFSNYEQTIEDNEPIGDYLEELRREFRSINVAEINFSAQYLFVEENDQKCISIFDFIDHGVMAMWQFLHAMKVDLNDNSDVANSLIREIDLMVRDLPRHWIIDVIDYCYNSSTDKFERGNIFAMVLPEMRISGDIIWNQIKQMSPAICDFYDAFICLHAFIYVEQKHNLMSTFFIEYDDGSYQTIVFSFSLRTTMYRYINRVASIIKENNIKTVYLVTETVGYGAIDIRKAHKLLLQSYEGRKQFRTTTYLSFYKVNSDGDIFPIMMNADDLVDSLSMSVAFGKMKTTKQPEQECLMMTPIVEAFKAKKKHNRKEK